MHLYWCMVSMLGIDVWHWCMALIQDIDSLMHGVGAWDWCTVLMHGVGACYWYMTLMHVIDTWPRYMALMSLIHSIDAWYCYKVLVHGGWCMTCLHGIGAYQLYILVQYFGVLRRSMIIYAWFGTWHKGTVQLHGSGAWCMVPHIVLCCMTQFPQVPEHWAPRIQ